MNVACLTEFQCAVYADGELPAHEARDMTEHLQTCASCRQLVAALRVENRVLVECLQATDFIDFELEDEALSAPQAHRLGVVRFVGLVLAMSVVLRPLLDALEQLGLMNGMYWLAISLTYIVPAAVSVVGSVWSYADRIALCSILFLGLVLFSRRSALTSSVLSVLAILTVFSSPSYGLDVRQGDRPVRVPSGETVDDTLVIAGESASIDGTVTGDLVAFVRDLTIRGTVKGNVISFARRVELDGTVEGSVIGFAQSIYTRGQADHNIYAFAQTTDIASDARVGDNAMIFASSANIEGTVGKDVNTWVAGSMNVSGTADIGGSLTANVLRAESAYIAPEASIRGTTDIRTAPPSPSPYVTMSFYLWQTIRLTAAFLTGLVLMWIFPALSRVSFDTTRELLLSAGVGFVTLIALPIVALIAAVTVVGLPLGLITLAGWLATLYAAKIVVAGFLGRSLVRSEGTAPTSTALALLVGLLLVAIAVNLPYVGGLVNFLLTLLGLGAIAFKVYQMPRWQSAQAA